MKWKQSRVSPPWIISCHSTCTNSTRALCTSSSDHLHSSYESAADERLEIRSIISPSLVFSVSPFLRLCRLLSLPHSPFLLLQCFLSSQKFQFLPDQLQNWLDLPTDGCTLANSYKQHLFVITVTWDMTEGELIQNLSTHGSVLHTGCYGLFGLFLWNPFLFCCWIPSITFNLRQNMNIYFLCTAVLATFSFVGFFWGPFSLKHCFPKIHFKSCYFLQKLTNVIRVMRSQWEALKIVSWCSRGSWLIENYWVVLPDLEAQTSH